MSTEPVGALGMFIAPNKDTIEVPAPHDVTRGMVFKVGDRYLAALADTLSGETVVGVKRCHRSILQKNAVAGESFTTGAKVYVDDATHKLTAVVGTNKVVGTANEDTAETDEWLFLDFNSDIAM